MRICALPYSSIDQKNLGALNEFLNKPESLLNGKKLLLKQPKVDLKNNLATQQRIFFNESY